jgi:hypothetical protein
VLPQENIDDLRHDVAGTLVELFLGEVGDGVGHRQVFIIWHAPGFCHRPTGSVEYVGNDRSGWDAALLKHNAIEHTARAARASVSHPGNDHIALGQDVANDLFVCGHTGAPFAPHEHPLYSVLVLEDLADFQQ